MSRTAPTLRSFRLHLFADQTPAATGDAIARESGDVSNAEPGVDIWTYEGSMSRRNCRESRRSTGSCRRRMACIFLLAVEASCHDGGVGALRIGTQARAHQPEVQWSL